MFTRAIFNISQLAKKRGIDFHENQNPIVLAMLKKMNELKEISFTIEHYPDGSWTAESTNITGILTGGNDVKEISRVIKGAVFTYFEIPPYLVNYDLVRMNNEPVTIEQKVYTTKVYVTR